MVQDDNLKKIGNRRELFYFLFSNFLCTYTINLVKKNAAKLAGSISVPYQIAQKHTKILYSKGEATDRRRGWAVEERSSGYDIVCNWMAVSFPVFVGEFKTFDLEGAFGVHTESVLMPLGLKTSK